MKKKPISLYRNDPTLSNAVHFHTDASHVNVLNLYESVMGPSILVLHSLSVCGSQGLRLRSFPAYELLSGFYMNVVFPDTKLHKITHGFPVGLKRKMYT